jgi:hypothetical protein
MSDCEIPSFYSHKERLARKTHKCCECTATILPGEKHFFVTGKWDGKINRYRQHLLCEEACEFIRDSFVDYECIGYGSLWEWYCDAKDWLNDPLHKKKEDSKAFRAMMAKILWRERH